MLRLAIWGVVVPAFALAWVLALVIQWAMGRGWL